jgi:hypothetical protein
MRLRLLLIFLLAFAAMGADCGGGGSSSGGSFTASSGSATTASTNEGRDDLSQPVPEPSALIVFGAGLLVAGAALRRNR